MMRSLLLMGALVVAAGSGLQAQMRIGTNFAAEHSPWASGVNWATTTNPWNPAVLSDIGGAGYACLRFMSWQNTNNCIETNWSDRRLPTASNSGVLSFNQNVTPCGYAYEWLIDMANRLNTSLWLSVPHRASDDHMRSLANLVKEQLNPSLKCYIEFSNETWNGVCNSFQQACEVEQRARQLNLIGHYTWSGITGMYWRQAYHIYRSGQMFQIFQEVFGAQMSSRIGKVTGGFSQDPTLTEYMMRKWLWDPKVNPSGQIPDAFAIAPYYGNNCSGTDTACLRQSLRSVRMAVRPHRGQLNLMQNEHPGVRVALFCYEGGPHIYGKGGADTWARNPMNYEFETAYLDTLNAAGVELYCYFLHCGNWTSSYAWGAKACGTDGSSAPRWRAIMDWKTTHPVSTLVQSSGNSVGRSTPAPSSVRIVFDLRGRKLPADPGAVRSVHVQCDARGAVRIAVPGAYHGAQ